MPAGSLVRRAADAAFGRYARQRVRTIDRLDAVETQRHTLLRLVRQAQHTCFGREHDFQRIRSVTDYQRRVPLRDYEAFWQTYWQPAYPRLCDVTWPGLIPYLAMSSGTTSGATKYIPVSRDMLASNRRAALTTLALFRAAQPNMPLFQGASSSWAAAPTWTHRPTASGPAT